MGFLPSSSNLTIFPYWVGPVPHIELFGRDQSKNSPCIKYNKLFHKSFIEWQGWWRWANIREGHNHDCALKLCWSKFNTNNPTKKTIKHNFWNKLSKLQASLVWNYDWLTDSLTGVKCRATSVAKNYALQINQLIPGVTVCKLVLTNTYLIP